MSDGIVLWFDHRKGYGFIRSSDGKDMFMHTKLMPRNGCISPGDRVRFESSIEHKGLASGVRVIKHKREINNSYLGAAAANF